jgi:hypothetical protein
MQLIYKTMTYKTRLLLNLTETQHQFLRDTSWMKRTNVNQLLRDYIDEKMGHLISSSNNVVIADQDDDGF